MDITVEIGGAALTFTLPDTIKELDPDDVVMTEMVMQQMTSMLCGALLSAPLTPVMMMVIAEQLLLASHICLEVLNMSRDFINEESPHVDPQRENDSTPVDKSLEWFTEILDDLDLGDDDTGG